MDAGKCNGEYGGGSGIGVTGCGDTGGSATATVDSSGCAQEGADTDGGSRPRRAGRPRGRTSQTRKSP